MKQDNKLIAEFMNVDKHGDTEFIVNRLICNYESMQYKTSWDWLIPVIDKIGKTDCDHEPLANVSIYSSIEEIYKEVVEFIKWYNKNK